jgi:hypothetical protein
MNRPSDPPADVSQRNISPKSSGQSQSQRMNSQPGPEPAPGDDPGTLTDEDSLFADGPDAVDAAAPTGSDTRRDQVREKAPDQSDKDRSQTL